MTERRWESQKEDCRRKRRGLQKEEYDCQKEEEIWTERRLGRDRQQKMADRKKRGLIRQKKKETWGRTEKGKKKTKRRGLIDVSKKMVDRKKFGNGEYVCV